MGGFEQGQEWIASYGGMLLGLMVAAFVILLGLKYLQRGFAQADGYGSYSEGGYGGSGGGSFDEDGYDRDADIDGYYGPPGSGMTWADVDRQEEAWAEETAWERD